MSEGFAHSTRRQAAKIVPGMQEAATRTREAISHAVEDAPEHMARWYDHARVQGKHLKEMGAEQYKVVRGQMREHAVLSTAIAFTTGFLMARFLFRR